jgi:hypothetical protein
MASPALAVIVLLMMLSALVSSRPWRARDEPWFDESALLAALLLGGLLVALA